MLQGPGINRTFMWNNKDVDGFGGFSAAEEFQNPVFGSVDTNRDGVCGFNRSEAANKKIKLTESIQRGEEANTFEELSSLGLTLSKTPSFLNLLEMKLSEGRTTYDSAETNHSSDYGRVRAKMDDFVSQKMSEKLKASKFSVSFLRIGTWERATRNGGDLVAKCFFTKRKLVWEVLEKGLKKKIEVQWGDILAIRATTQENEPGILEIELNQPPIFFQEMNPQPRKQTLWHTTSDFTGGQASIFRRHYLRFPPGALDKHYEKILQYDDRLLSLSQRPFPSLESPFFYSYFNNAFLQFLCNLNGSDAYIPHGLNFPLSSIPPSSWVPSHQVQSFEHKTNSASPMSDETSSNIRFANPMIDSGINNNTRIEREDQTHELPFIAPMNQVSPAFFYQDYHRSTYGEKAAGRPKRNILDIEKILLSDSQVVCFDERTLLEKEKLLSSLLEPTKGVSLSNVTSTMHKDLRQDRAPSDHFVPSTSADDHSVPSTSADDDHFNGNDGLIYPQHIRWVSPQVSNENLPMHLQRNNSLYPYEFSAPPMEDFATIDTLNRVNHWA